MNLNLTESAAEHVQALLEKEGKSPQHALRVRVTSGGCSGFQYQMFFDDQAGPEDHEDLQHGVRVLVDSKSAARLEGVRIDYVDGLSESGFQIQNPAATQTCGCGKSFDA